MYNEIKGKKIALVHDYLLGIGGAERVLKAMHAMFPQAPIYSVVYDRKFTDAFLPAATMRGSFLQKLPIFLRKRYKYFALLIPSAAERLDLSQYDVVISSCSAFVKGVITRPDTVHICYCHTPTRYLWDWTHPYLKTLTARGLAGILSKVAVHLLRVWDQQAARRVDYFASNSKHVASRIKKYYGRDAKVIYPPVEIGKSGKAAPNLPANQYYLIVSQLRPYKQIDVAIDAFRKLGFPLAVIGEGSDKDRLRRRACGAKNIRLLGRVPEEVLACYYENCRAFVFPGEEDFGIAMVEAMLWGKPVLALKRGGAKEIVIEGITGEFFDSPHPLLLADGLRRLNENYKNYSAQLIRKRGEKFSRGRFEKEFLAFVAECCKL